jgi:hypothetical protein
MAYLMVILWIFVGGSGSGSRQVGRRVLVDKW